MGDDRKDRIKPTISVITIVLNGSAHIEDTIKSVITQDYENIEYIVVDGGSIDGTIDIIKRYEDSISKWVSEPDCGIADAMNKGIKMASGDIIGIIHADDYYEPGAVSAVLDAFNKDPDVGVVHGNMILLSSRRSCSVECRPVKDIEKDAWKIMPVLHPTVFVKKAVYGKFGLFNTAYRIAMDYDMILRFLENRVRFKFLEKNIATMRDGGISTILLHKRYREVRDIAVRHGYSRLKVNAMFVFNTTFRPMEEKIGLLLRAHGMGGIAWLYRKIFYPGVPKDF